MGTSQSASTQIQFPHKLNAAFSELRLPATHPHLIHAIRTWWTDESETLYELKKNGSGKQIVLKYSAPVFLEFCSLALQANNARAGLTKAQKEAYVAVMVALGLITAENAGFLVGASRSTVTAWGVHRSPLFPLRRIGGHVDVDTLGMLSAWWAGKVKDPNDGSNDWMLIAANNRGAAWPVLARLTGMSMYEIQRTTRRVQAGRVGSINVTINHAASSVQTDTGSQGHLSSSSESSPEGPDLVDDEYDEGEFGSSLIKPPVAVDDGDAFASAPYLAAVAEADSGDAGQPDAAQDGIHPSGEGDRRDGEEEADREVHPFFQPE